MSSVYQGFQSLLELRHIEQRSLRLKLALPKTNFSASSIAPSTKSKHVSYMEVKDTINDCKSIGNQNVDTSGCSFLQSLANADDSDST
ncbi:hypothetical protein HRI_003782700 [Hibiscus trionum]|uniref:Uncharacterized protein n=1 Tax=Hibiscus trionum TaxID=183268 RepID=A0A9W7MIJ0_HIBTR|nr:hypothetical protein HRI_003782700 [Hibiscus trionum]